MVLNGTSNISEEKFKRIVAHLKARNNNYL
jgi:hypothetical protein